MAENDNHYPQSVLSRTKLLEGRYIFSIINNGGSYFLVDLPVFEDGVVNCWEHVDLDMLKKKIHSGWVSPGAPDRVRISLHHLGGWEIEYGKWLYSKENYFDFIVSVIRTMNPSLSNLYNANGVTSKVIGNTNYSVFAYSAVQLVRKDGDRNASFVMRKGKREHFFYRQSDQRYWLCSLDVYNDGNVLIDGIDTTRFISLDEVKELIKRSVILTKIPDHSTIMIKDLGEMVISKTLYSIDISDRVLELDDILASLNGEQTTSDICAESYKRFIQDPTPENRQKLKTAYENMPRHLRIYVLGDMDEKDNPIREAIYGE